MSTHFDISVEILNQVNLQIIEYHNVRKFREKSVVN